jgi:hypothetical protein
MCRWCSSCNASFSRRSLSCVTTNSRSLVQQRVKVDRTDLFESDVPVAIGAVAESRSTFGWTLADQRVQLVQQVQQVVHRLSDRLVEQRNGHRVRAIYRRDKDSRAVLQSVNGSIDRLNEQRVFSIGLDEHQSSMTTTTTTTILRTHFRFFPDFHQRNLLDFAYRPV